jgi:hypothetical protein
VQASLLFCRYLTCPMIAIALTACGFVHDKAIDGPYRLVAIDVEEQMGVCYSIKDACVGRIVSVRYGQS